jgi:hypothetical protein
MKNAARHRAAARQDFGAVEPSGLLPLDYSTHASIWLGAVLHAMSELGQKRALASNRPELLRGDQGENFSSRLSRYTEPCVMARSGLRMRQRHFFGFLPAKILASSS